MGIALLLFSSGIVNYLVITVCCFGIMVCSTVFTVQIMSFVQTETPPNLIGKIIAVMMAVSMCAQPLGNALYGILFEVVLFAGFVSLAIAVGMKNIFKRLIPKTGQE